MIFLARRRRILPPPPLVERAPQPPAPSGLSEALDAIEDDIDRAMGRPPRHARPASPVNHEPEPVIDPLTAPGFPITETAVFGHLLEQSPVREFGMKTARASNLRFPVHCLCGREHHNVNADTFHDLYASARNAEWQEDQFGTWRCPRCARRYQSALGVAPIAAIEAGAA